MKKFNLLIILVLMLLTAKNVNGQNACGNTLDEANKSYEAGDFANSVSQLLPCLNLGFDKDQKLKGYRLLALSFLALKDRANARKAAENMLEQNPLYKPNLLQDTRDFIDLVNSIAVVPKFSFGLAGAGGINNTLVSVTHQDNEYDFSKNYSSKIGTQFGLSLGYSISREFSVGVDLNASSKNYSINYSTNDFNITDNEHLSFLDVPLYVTYTYGKRNLRPFIRLGGYEDFLLSANSDFSATYQPNKSSYADNGVNSNDRRNSTDFGLLGAIGLNWKFDPAWQLFVDFRYTYGLTNIVNDAKRYSDQGLIYNYFYLDDDLKINNSLITIGVVRNLDFKVIGQK